MAFDFPSPATTGQQFTPAGGPTYTWNGYAWVVRGAGGPPADAFVATLSVDQTGVVASTWTKANFNTAGYNQNGKFNTSTSRWTPSAGLVQIEATLLCNTATTGTLAVAIYKNNSLLKQSTSLTETCTAISVVDNAGGTDYYECWVLSGGVANSISSNPVATFFQGFAIAPQGPAGLQGPQGTPGPTTPADAFIATLSADQTGIPAQTTKINFNTAIYNQNGKYNLATQRWTPSAGPVQLELQIFLSAGNPTTVAALIFKNGVSFKQMNMSGGFGSISVVDTANGTDYYEAYVSMSGGTAPYTAYSNSVYTFFQGFAVAPQGPAGATGPQGPTTPPDCGRLILGAASPSSTLKFVSYKGDQIKINGTIYPIPAAGITSPSTAVYVNGVSGQNLAVSTVYWVYLFNNVGTLTFDFCTTTHTTSLTAGNIGVEIKSADDTRSLIGLIYTTSSGNLFVDDPTSRTVRSWFNRPRTNFARVASGWGGSSTSWASTGFAAYFLTFADDVIDITHHGYIIDNVASALCGLAIGIDSLSPLGQPSQGHNGGANYYVPLSTRYTTSGLSENVIHTINPLYTVNAGSATGYTDLTGTIG